MPETSRVATPQSESAARNGELRSHGAVEVSRLDEGVDLPAPHRRRDALGAVENGGVVLLPRSGFELLARERDLISDLRNSLVKAPGTANGRPTIIFEPLRQRIARFNFAYAGRNLVRAEVKRSVRPELEAM